MNLEPRGREVLAQCIKPKEMKRGGIVMPQRTQDGFQNIVLARVIAVGPEVEDIRRGVLIYCRRYDLKQFDMATVGVPGLIQLPEDRVMGIATDVDPGEWEV